ncbi:MAG: argininosuccinate lyase [Pseudomonadota bacterium]
MKYALILITTVTTALAGCGVDGEPKAPEAKSKPGIAVTGRAEIGVSKRR